MLPGTDFGFKETELFFRIAFVDFDGEKILESYQKNTCIDEDFIKKNYDAIKIGNSDNNNKIINLMKKDK